MSNKKFVAFAGMLALAFTMNTGCGKKPGSTTEAPPAGDKKEAAAPAAPAAPAAGSGSIKGKVSFTGTAPDMPELKREADPFCAKTKMKDQEVVVNANGTLKNVALVVQGGAASTPEAISAWTVMVGRRCRRQINGGSRPYDSFATCSSGTDFPPGISSIRLRKVSSFARSSGIARAMISMR